MRSVAILLCCLFAVSFIGAKGQEVSRIKAQPGEKWWGIYVGGSPAQPFSGNLSVDTGQSDSTSFRTGRLISSAGRYIHLRHPARIAFEDDRFTVTSDTEKAEPQRGGRTLRQAYLTMNHRDLQRTDKYPAKELFTNLVYETHADFGFTQTAVDILSYASQLLEAGYPPGIMVLADGWRNSSGYDFDQRYYPDPAGFIDQMHKLGFLVMLTVTPYIPAWGRQYSMLKKEGGLVAWGPGGESVAPNAEPLVITDPREGTFAAIDMTDPMQIFGMKESLVNLQRGYGVDGFRFDCVSLIDAVADLSTARAFIAAMYEAGSEFALTEFRPGKPEFQTDYMSEVRTSQNSEPGYIMDVMTAGLVAGPFTQVLPPKYEPGSGAGSADIRRALIGAAMPVAHVPFKPWRYEQYEQEIKRVLSFREAISGYMANTYAEVCKSLEPIIRPMEYMFPREGFADCVDQYMLGSKYLIAPPLGDNPKRLVRLPRGVWRDMHGKRFRGPRVLEIENDGYRLVWFQQQ